jgi:chromodomain-helicase-DNA-binding protein 1
LKQVATITSKNYPNKADRAVKLRSTIEKIGEFIHNTLGGGDPMPSLERRLWDYVAVHYWPNKEVGGAKLQLMFEKVKAASKPSQPSNGT